MTKYGRRSLWVTLLIVGILFADQILKFWVKTHMCLHETIPVWGNWFKIAFIENEGMAFGWIFGGEFGKLFLSIFRIVLVILIAIYLYRLIHRDSTPVGVFVGLSLILVGALGNIVDSVCYGLVFSASTPEEVARFLPLGGGYAGFLQGKVVDMLYFPLIDTFWPRWVPFVGGRQLLFFRYIFNIADAAITCGVFYLLFFKYRFFYPRKKK